MATVARETGSRTKERPKERVAELGVIRADELYPLAVFKRRMGLGTKAWWELRDLGLKTRRQGHHIYVLGKHVLELFERLAEDGAKPVT
jgi:hypothetical protein